jgi:hypothetical protein
VRVWKEPEASGIVTVRPDGKITLALGGDVQASGLTPEQLSRKVTEALSNYINRPQVTVMVQAVFSKKYYISGEVNRPGVSVVVPTTIVERSTSRWLPGVRDAEEIASCAAPSVFNFITRTTSRQRLDQNVQLENGTYRVSRILARQEVLRCRFRKNTRRFQGRDGEITSTWPAATKPGSGPAFLACRRGGCGDAVAGILTLHAVMRITRPRCRNVWFRPT